MSLGDTLYAAVAVAVEPTVAKQQHLIVSVCPQFVGVV